MVSSANTAVGLGEGLTRAEQNVLAILLTGAHNHQIAKQLSLSEATIRTHLTHIYSKVGVDGRAALLARVNTGTGVEPPSAPPSRRRLSWAITVVLLAILALALALFVYMSFAAAGPQRTFQPRTFDIALTPVVVWAP